MTSRERVIRAVEMKGPDRIPIYIPQDPLSDIAVCHPGAASGVKPSRPGETEWGFVWEKIDMTMGQPKENPLADMVFGYEEEIIRGYGERGIDGVTFYNDWGTQNNLIINPALWREFFMPRYKSQFDLIHSYGMHVYFHSCGNCYDIIEDLIAIGADMLNLNQPTLFGIERLGEEFGGRVCFVCPVDIQTTAIHGDIREIRSDAERMIRSLGRFNGGFIGLVENYDVMGFVSDETKKACIRAFQELGVYRE